MVVHLTQPSGMRRFVDVFDAPREFGSRGFCLTKKTTDFRVDDAGDPVHDKKPAPPQLLCLLKNRDRLLNVAIPVQQRQRRSMLGPQQTDDAQIKRLLDWRQTPFEFLEAGREELRSLTHPV